MWKESIFLVDDNFKKWAKSIFQFVSTPAHIPQIEYADLPQLARFCVTPPPPVSLSLPFSNRHRHPLSEQLRPPDAARVILASRDDVVALVVEGTGEDLVGVSLEDLRARPRVGVP